MDPVAAQYEAFPYPARDPLDEAKRLVRGSPSDPAEIDHFVFGGARDWRQPFRALVAGGGTGDALVMLAQLLSDAGCPAELTYLDMSQASRTVAEARISARGLSGSVRFVTGDILHAAALGPFDYIDCCGVLHHLARPQEGFDALAAALAPGGGLGGMVYAPYGRTGVYAMQAALSVVAADDAPARRLERAKAVLAKLPPSNWLLRNDLLSDHKTSDAGLYDLLLHARDMPFTADAVIAAVEAAGLTFCSFIEPARYRPETWLGDLAPRDLSQAVAAALAEQLCGGVKAHVFYARKGDAQIAGPRPEAVPRLRGITATALAGQAGKRMTVRRDGAAHVITLPRESAPILRRMDGRSALGGIAQAVGTDWVGFSVVYAPIHRQLEGFGLLHYSRTFS